MLLEQVDLRGALGLLFTRKIKNTNLVDIFILASLRFRNAVFIRVTPLKSSAIYYHDSWCTQRFDLIKIERE
jgi:hypothetical protein